MTTSKHASWINTPYDTQIDIDEVGPHALGVDWEGYNARPTRSEATTTVSTLSGLWTARDNATAGDIIWLDQGDYLIDGETYRQDIPADVTIASDGARIYSNNGQNGVFELTNNGARLTGIHFEGHQATGTVSDYQQYIGVLCRADVEVDNCIFNQWSLTGVYVGFPSEDAVVVSPHIHHCLTYDNRWDGYGYGFAVYDGADPLIEYNFLNNNRHGLAGGGNNNCSYRVYNNLHGTGGRIHQFEQHPNPGGDRMDIRNNELRMTQKNGGGTDVRAYSQRGTPQTRATINDNWIYNPVAPGAQPDTSSDAAIVQYEHGSAEWVNVEFANNSYGSTEPTDSAIGIQSLSDLNAAPAPTHTLNVELTDNSGTAIGNGQVEIYRVGDVTASWDYEVAASDGPAAIQTTLNGAASGESVRVNGSGNYSWDQSLEVPNGVTLDISTDITVTVPSSHSVTSYAPGGANVYSLITNQDRTAASNVTIRGGTFDLSNMPEDEATDAEYAGVWLHNATDSTIDNVEVHGAGTAIYDAPNNRAFGIALTNCTRGEIRDSDAYDSGYDDIGVRGDCQNCNVIRSGGSGAPSGTIQTAAWGKWGLSTAPTGTTFYQCYGRRIYGHDDADTTWDDCTTGYRLQTLGTDGAEVRNSAINGYVLLYTYSSATDTALVEGMTFQSSSRQDAVQIGTNGGYDIGTVTVRDSTATRNRLLNFNSYSTNGTITSVTFTNVDFTGEGTTPTIVNQESGASQAGTLRFDGCEFSNVSTGITGTYDTLEVVNCTFNSFASEAEAINVTANTLTTTGNTYNG